MKTLPAVTVVMPVRNEEKHIAGCLESVLGGTYPKDRLEVLVVDGMSDDRTRDIIRGFAENHQCVRLIDNPARVVPHAMNAGILAARGEIIVRMDAHAMYGPDYVRQLVTWMADLGADNVGGVWITKPASDSSQAKAVALILSHSFGVGSATYRIGSAAEPVEVDTVPFGCYRREIFGRIGLYDEMFIRNQDDELNARLKMSGGKIFLIPEIRIDYVARESLRKMSRMLYQYGFFKPLIAIKLGRPATVRQLIPPSFAATVLALPLALTVAPTVGIVMAAAVLAHSTVNLTVSMRQAMRHGWRLLPALFAGFFLAHMAYGIGYLHGLIDFGLLSSRKKAQRLDASLSR
jgi:glycosyltransferase involved in cell wall biosynthesis